MVYIKKGHGLPHYFMFQPKHLTILNEFSEIHCYSTTMVANHDWPCFLSKSIWPWSTLVSLVPFNVHGQPWSENVIVNTERTCLDKGTRGVFEWLKLIFSTSLTFIKHWNEEWPNTMEYHGKPCPRKAKTMSFKYTHDLREYIVQ